MQGPSGEEDSDEKNPISNETTRGLGGKESPRQAEGGLVSRHMISEKPNCFCCRIKAGLAEGYPEPGKIKLVPAKPDRPRCQGGPAIPLPKGSIGRFVRLMQGGEKIRRITEGEGKFQLNWPVLWQTGSGGRNC
jgi:hypothetical protein